MTPDLTRNRLLSLPDLLRYTDHARLTPHDARWSRGSEFLFHQHREAIPMVHEPIEVVQTLTNCGPTRCPFELDDDRMSSVIDPDGIDSPSPICRDWILRRQHGQAQ